MIYKSSFNYSARAPPQIFVSDCHQSEATSSNRAQSVLDGFAEGWVWGSARTVPHVVYVGSVVFDVAGIPARVLVDGVSRTGRRVSRWRLGHVPAQSRSLTVCDTL
jgi:hypothetical protein